MQTIVIGGGAAGFFSAIHTQINHPEGSVVIIEQSSQVLSKVKISGGGRCNVTHACFEPKGLAEHYPRGSKELLGPFHRFSPKDTMAWFESHGVPLKIESDNRVFPVSDASQDIIDCLVQTAARLGIKVWTGCRVANIAKEGPDFCITLADGNQHRCQKLILATGSNPGGYAFAQGFGHTLVKPIPSLFTVAIPDKALQALSGLSVKNAEVWLEGEKKQSQKGPLLVTHWGLSGPSIIKLSAWNAEVFHRLAYNVSLRVNWLPGLKPEALKSALIDMQAQNPKKRVGTQSPFAELPTRLWDYLVAKAGILEEHTWNGMGLKWLERLIQELSAGLYLVAGKGVFKDEFVTCGGVSLKEIDFKTMQSKKCEGLYIVGELLNIDGITGGFNFQNAWTTGYIAGLTGV